VNFVYFLILIFIMTKFDVCEYIKANPSWLAGLIDGEGCFSIGITN
jgi:hypothetical protein